MPKFSIIIPIYNVEKYINTCLESIKTQTFTDFEVLLTDDCGTDGSMAIVEQYAKEDSRFKILKHEYNQGVSAARNTALDSAIGEYIIFVDSDDWIESDLLESVNNAIVANPSAQCIWYNSMMHYPNGNQEVLGKDSFNKENYTITLTPNNMRKLVGCIWDKVYIRTKVEELNIRFPVGLITEDDEYSFKYLSNVETCYYITKPLYNYRRYREGSLTTEDVTGDRIRDQFEIFMHLYNYSVERNLFQKYKITLVQMLGEIIKSVSTLKDKREEIIKRSAQVLQQINFPQDFWDLANGEIKSVTLWK